MASITFYNYMKFIYFVRHIVFNLYFYGPKVCVELSKWACVISLPTILSRRLPRPSTTTPSAATKSRTVYNTMIELVHFAWQRLRLILFSLAVTYIVDKGITRSIFCYITTLKVTKKLFVLIWWSLPHHFET